jgi:hypothetical protein
MLLIAGGSKDHNIARLARAAAREGAAHRVILTDSDPAPALAFDPCGEEIYINGESFAPENTSLFLRYDVFGGDPARTGALHDALKGWAQARPAVRMFNGGNEGADVNKVRNLRLAREAGLAVPRTLVTADFNAAAITSAGRENWIVKPIEGGSYTRTLPAADAMTRGEPARPCFVQERLAYPELRLFRVGEKLFAFAIDAATIDSREDRAAELRETAPPENLAAPFRALTKKLGLTYAAADFKTRPGSGELLFLEINTMPMFTGYDDAAQGRLSAAMVEFLTRRAPAPARAPALKK